MSYDGDRPAPENELPRKNNQSYWIVCEMKKSISNFDLFLAERTDVCTDPHPQST